jgi:pathogenesis-related protein 1
MELITTRFKRCWYLPDNINRKVLQLGIIRVVNPRNESCTKMPADKKVTNWKSSGTSLVPPPPPQKEKPNIRRWSSKSAPPPPPVKSKPKSAPTKNTSSVVTSPKQGAPSRKARGSILTWLLILLIIAAAVIGATYSAGLWNLTSSASSTYQDSGLPGCNPNVTTPFTTITASEINDILFAHNQARRRVNPTATIMPPLKWNYNLAIWAQNFEDACPGIVHSSNVARSNIAGFSYIGENLAAGYSSWISAVAGWVDEGPDFTYPATCGAGKVCGHYTQVIWAKSTDVGCGFKVCPGSTYSRYYRCVYGPGGNYVGAAPYIQSANASDTDVCTDSVVFG